MFVSIYFLMYRLLVVVMLLSVFVFGLWVKRENVMDILVKKLRFVFIMIICINLIYYDN